MPEEAMSSVGPDVVPAQASARHSPAIEGTGMSEEARGEGDDGKGPKGVATPVGDGLTAMALAVTAEKQHPLESQAAGQDAAPESQAAGQDAAPESQGAGPSAPAH